MLKRHVVIKAKKFHPKINLRIDLKIIFFFTLMVCGIIIGVFITGKSSNEWHRFFSNLINEYINLKQNNEIFTLFFRIFLPFFILHIIVYIIGLCGMGIPFFSIIPLILGMFFGVEITVYYTTFGISGVGYCALILSPVYAIATATLIKCCCHCFDISKEIFFYLVTGKGEGKPLLKEYSFKHMFFLVPIIVGSMLSVLLFKVFVDLFNFV